MICTPHQKLSEDQINKDEKSGQVERMEEK
jgi:hypothetical protein